MNRGISLAVEKFVPTWSSKYNNRYDEDGNVIPRKPGPKPGSHHKTVKLKKDGTPKQKPGQKPGSKRKSNSEN